MKTSHFFFVSMLVFLFGCNRQQQAGISLTLIPPTTITNKVKLDIRAGICNTQKSKKKLTVLFYLNEETFQNLLFKTTIELAPHSSECVKFIMPTADHVGVSNILLIVKEGKEEQKIIKKIEILNSDNRSAQTIDGAWLGLYHWSEEEGKYWNLDIKKVTDDQWRELVCSMHKLNMNIIVVQEVFRNQEYVGENRIAEDGYKGKAFYPSRLYKGRMPIKAKDPLEAILSEADKQGMNVFLGVGLFAWFDFSSTSLEWHKEVAKELWDMYGHHPSFYGFYVSEESGGSLDNWEKKEGMRIKRKAEIVNFFKEFKTYCNQFAPSKPIMLATNSMGLPSGEDTYSELLKSLDILCPFGFDRMPEKDLTGEQAANLLQKYCDASGTHLWFDLEAFLFNKDGSLSPRPIEQIAQDLILYKNFEKTICYQYPGVFNDPDMSIRIGEPSATKLFLDYQKYLSTLNVNK
jgi:hypothetical protein